jgi:hypothetical protein
MFRFAQHDLENARFNRSRSGVRCDSTAFRPKDCLLKILNLLADLLQFALQPMTRLGDCSVIRFRSERVEFSRKISCVMNSSVRPTALCSANDGQIEQDDFRAASALPIHQRDRQKT